MIMEETLQDPKKVRKQQDRIRAKYTAIAEADSKHFAAIYAHMQAAEICEHLKTLALTPFTGLHSSLKQFFELEENQYRFYLQLNEFGMLEPDTERIEQLVLKDPVEI